MIAHRTIDSNFEQVKSLVPDWIAIEASYANAKYNEKNPQRQEDMRVSLSPGGPGRRDFLQYFGRFATFFRQSQDAGVDAWLHASKSLGKFVSTGRALTSAVNQRLFDVEIPQGDGLTVVEFEALWSGVDDFTVIDRELIDEMFHGELEKQIDGLAAVAGDMDKLHDDSLEFLIQNAKLFGGFTLQHTVMATPGVSSTDMPTPWEHYRPVIN